MTTLEHTFNHDPQTLLCFEIVLVDDGSADRMVRTKALLKEGGYDESILLKLAFAPGLLRRLRKRFRGVIR